MPSLQPQFVGPSDTAAKLNWERELMVGVSKAAGLLNPALGLVGDTEEFAFQRKKRLFEEGGTTGRIFLERPLRGKMRFGNDPEHGNEEGQRTDSWDTKINQVRKSFAVPGYRVTKQRVPYETWTRGRRLLSRHIGTRLNAAYQMHLTGFNIDATSAVTGVSEWYWDGTDLAGTFSNVPRAPDTYHRFRPNSYTDDADVGADPTAIFDIPYLNTLKAIATNLPNPIRPFVWRGKEIYGYTLHPYQVVHLRNQNTQWMAQIYATMMGGGYEDGPMVTGALGIHNGILLIEDPFCPPAISTAGAIVLNARLNTFFGAQSLCLGLAKDIESDNQWLFDEQNWDYNNNKGLCATTMMGISKPGFRIDEVDATLVQDYGTIVASFYAKNLVGI